MSNEIIKKDDQEPMRESLVKLIDKAIENSCKIPSFIDGKTTDGYMAWKIMSDLLNEINFLIDNKVHSKQNMKDFYDSFVVMEANFIKVKDIKLYEKCVKHINKLMWSYLDWALENEEYETVANFKEFKTLKDSNPHIITKYLSRK